MENDWNSFNNDYSYFYASHNPILKNTLIVQESHSGSMGAYHSCFQIKFEYARS